MASRRMMKIDLLVLRCGELHASKQFYEQLGFQFVEEQHGRGPVHYSSKDAGFVFELYPLGRSELVDNTRLGFSVEGIEHIIPGLNLSGHYEFDGRQVYVVRDPDGRKVELSERKP